MTSDERELEAARAAKQDGPASGGDSAEPKQLSRLERLKNKIKKLQGKDPDIYPMW